MDNLERRESEDRRAARVRTDAPGTSESPAALDRRDRPDPRDNRETAERRARPVSLDRLDETVSPRNSYVCVKRVTFVLHKFVEKHVHTCHKR